MKKLLALSSLLSLLFAGVSAQAADELHLYN